MSYNILSSIDNEIIQIRNNIIDSIHNEEYWKKQHDITLLKCIKLNDELKYERYLHGLTKSCRNISLIDGLCDDIIQKIFDYLGYNGTLLLRTCKKLNLFVLKLKSINLNNSIHINLDHLREKCYLYTCINRNLNVTYIGDCVAGMPHGNGKISYSSNKFIKSELSGNFVCGYPNGAFVIVEEENISTDSIIDTLSWSVIYLNKGIIDYKRKCSIKNDHNHSFYNGEYSIDNTQSTSVNKSIVCKKGKGIEIINTETYNGNWLLNKYHGLGEYQINGKIRYSGYWSGGEPFCPEIGMYGDTGQTILETKHLIINGENRTCNVLILNENKYVVYDRVYDYIKSRVIVNKLGVITKNENGNWNWEI